MQEFLGVVRHIIDHTCIYVYMDGHTRTCIFTHICLYICININVYIYLHIHEGMGLFATGSYMYIRGTGWQ